MGCKGRIVDCLTDSWDCKDKDPLDPLLTVCYKTTKVKPQPVPNPAPKPVQKDGSCLSGCYDKNKNCLSSGAIPDDIENSDNGTKKFKEFILKYYPTFKDEIEKTEKVTFKKSKVTDCVFLKIYWGTDVNFVKLGVIGNIYRKWKNEKGENNVTNPSTEDFESWKKEIVENNISSNSYTKEDWQKLVDNDQISNKGKIISVNKKLVMLYKYSPDDNLVQIEADELNDDGSVNFKKVIENLKNESYIYRYFAKPTENNDDNTKEKYPLVSLVYDLVVKQNINGEDYIEPVEADYAEGIVSPNTEIKESFKYKKFLLEKIREKNTYKTIFVEDITTPQPTTKPIKGSPVDNKITKPSTDGKESTDYFALNKPENQLTTPDAKKSFFDKNTPRIQGLINRGYLSDYFLKWNETAKSVGSTTKLQLNNKGKSEEISTTNEYLIKTPTETGQYTKLNFIDFTNPKLKAYGDVNIDATIWQPIGMSRPQKFISGSSDPKKCRTQLVDYLRMGFKNEFLNDDFELWKKKRFICDCNANGGFINFQRRGKTEAGKETWRRDKLDIRPNKSDFTTKTEYTDPETGEKNTDINVLGTQSPYRPVLNKKLVWKEIVEILNGQRYKSIDGKDNWIDPDAVIDGFDTNGSICNSDNWKKTYDLNTGLKTESLENKVKNKINEAIKNKNASFVETTLRKILKDRL